MTHADATTAEPSRWALVTGASSGIGREFCHQLAARGYHLAMVARRGERLEALAGELKKSHATASLVMPLDLARPDASREIAARLREEGIFVEFLVNNAGYGVPGRFQDPNWQAHRDFLQVLVVAVCELTWRLLPEMQRRGRGSIVNVASVAGLVPGSEGHTLYGASKAFLIRFSESLAAENRRTGVRVSVLCPGFTFSEFHDVTGTRGLVDRLPDIMWLQSPSVVRYGIESVLRDPPRTVAVPGRFYRTLLRLFRYLPGFAPIFMRRMSHRFRHLEDQ